MKDYAYTVTSEMQTAVHCGILKAQNFKEAQESMIDILRTYGPGWTCTTLLEI